LLHFPILIQIWKYKKIGLCPRWNLPFVTVLSNFSVLFNFLTILYYCPINLNYKFHIKIKAFIPGSNSLNPRPLLTFVILWPNVAKGKKHVLHTVMATHSSPNEKNIFNLGINGIKPQRRRAHRGLTKRPTNKQKNCLCLRLSGIGSWIAWSASGLGLTYAFRLKTGRMLLRSHGIAGARACAGMLAGEGMGRAARKSF
jgi:hypothetical protein